VFVEESFADFAFLPKSAKVFSAKSTIYFFYLITQRNYVTNLNRKVRKKYVFE